MNDNIRKDGKYKNSWTIKYVIDRCITSKHASKFWDREILYSRMGRARLRYNLTKGYGFKHFW